MNTEAREMTRDEVEIYLEAIQELDSHGYAWAILVMKDWLRLEEENASLRKRVEEAEARVNEGLKVEE